MEKHWLLKLVFYHPAIKHSNGTWTTHRLFLLKLPFTRGLGHFRGFHDDLMGLDVHVRAKLKLWHFLVDGWLPRLEDYTTLYVLFLYNNFWVWNSHMNHQYLMEDHSGSFNTAQLSWLGD